MRLADKKIFNENILRATLSILLNRLIITQHIMWVGKNYIFDIESGGKGADSRKKARENGRPGKNKPGPRFRYGITIRSVIYLRQVQAGGSLKG